VSIARVVNVDCRAVDELSATLRKRRISSMSLADHSKASVFRFSESLEWAYDEPSRFIRAARADNDILKRIRQIQKVFDARVGREKHCLKFSEFVLTMSRDLQFSNSLSANFSVDDIASAVRRRNLQ
jgi:hypothetical protein